MEHAHRINPALLGLASVIMLGIGSQWLAARLRIPSILVLLLVGIVSGPVAATFYPQLHVIDPDALFGDLLLPFVSLCVALILYEGGLTLRLSELSHHGRVVYALVTIGALITWVLAGLAAHWILGLSGSLATLLGAILVVTGPTVIGPLLHHIRPHGPVGPILKWEGIVIDPIGALLAVLVFEYLVAGQNPNAVAAHTAIAIGKTIAFGGGFGILCGSLLLLVLRRYWVPDHLQASVSLGLTVAAYTMSNAVQAEAGLFAVTVMGIWVANQRQTDIRPIVEFKENLRVLLIAALFILLAARLKLSALQQLGGQTVLFCLVLIFLVRPLAVFASTIGAKLSFAERGFLAWMAPRGIVAASVASVFALQLERRGYADAAVLVPYTFAVIIATVAVYGLTALPLARRLGLTDVDPQGCLIIGAHTWARQIAKVLHAKAIRVVLVDSNRDAVTAARLDGLSAVQGNVLSERVTDDVELGGLGRLLALTPNDAVNEVAARRFMHEFGRQHVYQLIPKKRVPGGEQAASAGRARRLFNTDATFNEITSRFNHGATVKATPLSDEFDFAAFLEHHGAAWPLFTITKAGKVSVATADEPLKPQSGQTLIALVPAESPSPGAESAPSA